MDDMDTDDIMSCKRCGVFFDVTVVEVERDVYDYDSRLFICPVCKHKNHLFITDDD